MITNNTRALGQGLVGVWSVPFPSGPNTGSNPGERQVLKKNMEGYDGNLFGERFRDVRFALNDHHFVAINHTRKINFIFFKELYGKNLLKRNDHHFVAINHTRKINNFM